MRLSQAMKTTLDEPLIVTNQEVHGDGSVSSEPQSDLNLGNGDDGQKQKINAEVELAKIQERYKHSSDEGVRLARELAELKSQVQAQQDRQNVPKAPTIDEEAGVKYLMEQLGFDERQARFQVKNDIHAANARNALDSQIQIIMRQNEALNERLNTSQESLNPVVSEAKAYFEKAGLPEMMALPPEIQVERYNSLKKIGAVSVPRGTVDKSELLRSASSGQGSANGRTMAPSIENYNKTLFPSAQAAAEYAHITTQEQHEAFKRKYKK